ncbi:tropomodulin-4 isoform X1 [Sminthopsis crassicaudata]|uniref:tropomodulin-4 isoform X1 n=1 Tax=Sminthopsis crassicaudata TaxID=9301 RepID=UPI003D685F0F
MSSYQKELEKYRDIDEDEILRGLSPEELEQLDYELQEMDPENMLLPAGLRQRDQTKKSPTGPLDREALMQHLERQALETKERDDLVPFTGEKKGRGTSAGCSASHPAATVFCITRTPVPLSPSSPAYPLASPIVQPLHTSRALSSAPSWGLEEEESQHLDLEFPPLIPVETQNPLSPARPSFLSAQCPSPESQQLDILALPPPYHPGFGPCTRPARRPRPLQDLWAHDSHSLGVGEEDQGGRKPRIWLENAFLLIVFPLPGKPFIQPKREIPVEEQITLEPELEEALAKATDAEMCDIAAILGMYTLMSNKQYYDAICSGEICNTEGISSVVQPDKYKPVPDEPPNPTDVEETLKRIQNNDQALEEVNLNNMQDIEASTLIELCQAMKANTHVRSFSLVATRSGDPVANAVAEMLRENKNLQSLNIESNFISSSGLMAVLKAVRENSTLTELRMDNQRHWPGDAVEMEMAAMLEHCPAIVRFGYHFTQQGPRARAARAVTRNNELRRQQKKS